MLYLTGQKFEKDRPELAIMCFYRLLTFCAEYRLAMQFGVDVAINDPRRNPSGMTEHVLESEAWVCGVVHRPGVIVAKEGDLHASESFKILLALESEEAEFKRRTGSPTDRLVDVSKMDEILACEEARNRSTLAHGYCQPTKENCDVMADLATATFQKLHDLEGADFQRLQSSVDYTFIKTDWIEDQKKNAGVPLDLGKRKPHLDLTEKPLLRKAAMIASMLGTECQMRLQVQGTFYSGVQCAVFFPVLRGVALGTGYNLIQKKQNKKAASSSLTLIEPSPRFFPSIAPHHQVQPSTSSAMT